MPKQFQRVIGENSMLSQTLERLGDAADQAVIFANRSQVDALRRSARDEHGPADRRRA